MPSELRQAVLLENLATRYHVSPFEVLEWDASILRHVKLVEMVKETQDSDG